VKNSPIFGPKKRKKNLEKQFYQLPDFYSNDCNFCTFLPKVM